MADPHPQFSHLVTALKELKLGYLHLVESRISGGSDNEDAGEEKVDFLADIWGKTSPLLLAGGFTAESADEVAESYPGSDVMVIFGRYFIPNPDLPFRVKEGVPLTKYDRSTFYVSSPRPSLPRFPEDHVLFPISNWRAYCSW